MAGLADDWPENRQTCVDVLCGYLRMPYEPDPGEEAPALERLAFLASREVRQTVIRLIAAHLKADATVSWQRLNFDFTGVVFDGGSFRGAEFSGGTVSFNYARFPSGTFDFSGARFSGGVVNFYGAEFSGGPVGFNRARFSGGTVNFISAEFSGGPGSAARAVRSLSTPPSSPAARSVLNWPSSPAARSTSATLATGHPRPHSPGQARRLQA